MEVVSERGWFFADVLSALRQTHRVLQALGESVVELEDEDARHQLSSLPSLGDVLKALEGISPRVSAVFQSLLSEDVLAYDNTDEVVEGEQRQRERLMRQLKEAMSGLLGGNEGRVTAAMATFQSTMTSQERSRGRLQRRAERAKQPSPSRSPPPPRNNKRERAPQQQKKKSAEKKKQTKKKKVIEEGDDNDEEGSDEDNGKEEEAEEPSFVRQLLDEARVSIVAAESLLESSRTQQQPVFLSLSRKDIQPPDPTLCTAASGAELLANTESLSLHLSSAAAQESNDVEQWGSLLRWWGTLHKAYAVRGIFEHLRSRTGRTSMVKRYTTAMKRLSSKTNVGLQYSQATLYDRLAAFVLRYPRFVHQTRLTTLADWFQSLDGTRGVLLDALEVEISMAGHDGSDGFWNQSAVVLAVAGTEDEREKEGREVGVGVHDEPPPEVLPNGIHLDMVGDVAELPFQVSVS